MESALKVMVTGADGFLGSNIVRQLLSRGHEVNGFIQYGRDAHSLKGLPVKLHYGDLCNAKDLVPVLKHCDYIFHTAGITAMWPNKSDSSWKVNYLAVKQLVSLAMKYNIKRFIHIGTATSFGPGSLSDPGNENSHYSSDRFGMDYFDSKFKAQKYLIHKAKTRNFPVIILNPTFMIGPYDSASGSNRMILEIYNRNVPGYSRGGKNYIHVKDVANAAVNALQLGRLGECYIVGNKNMSYRTAFRMMAETLQVPGPKFQIPSYLAIVLGGINILASFFTGNDPKFSINMARVACVEYYYSPEKAISELNLSQTPIEIAIRESFYWYKEKGTIK